jgi:hypothetical protein
MWTLNNLVSGDKQNIIIEIMTGGCQKWLQLLTDCLEKQNSDEFIRHLISWLYNVSFYWQPKNHNENQ